MVYICSISQIGSQCRTLVYLKYFLSLSVLNRLLHYIACHHITYFLRPNAVQSNSYIAPVFVHRSLCRFIEAGWETSIDRLTWALNEGGGMPL